MSDKERSLQRSKKGLIRLADILTPVAMEAVLPGSGLAYAVTKTGFEQIKDYLSGKRDARIEELHRVLMESCKGKAEQEKLLSENLNVDDYYGILQAVVQDEEGSKTKIYARILRALLEGEIEARFRTHVIKSARELTVSTFDLMRELYVASQVLFKGQSDIKSQVREILSEDDPLRQHAVQSLIRYGYMSGDEVTNLLEKVVRLLYDEESLSAKAIGKTPWGEKYHIVLIAANHEDDKIKTIRAWLERLGGRLDVIMPSNFVEFNRERVLSGERRKLVCLLCADGASVHDDNVNGLFMQPNFKNTHPIVIILPGAHSRQYETKGLNVILVSDDISTALSTFYADLARHLRA